MMKSRRTVTTVSCSLGPLGAVQSWKHGALMRLREAGSGIGRWSCDSLPDWARLLSRCLGIGDGFCQLNAGPDESTS